MATTGHESEAINVQGLKASLQKLKTDHIDGKANEATTLAGYGITDAYTKTEVNDLVDTPNQGYISAVADSNTTTSNLKTLIDTAAGTDKEKAGFIYRVGCWDGTQYDDTVYSEYAWNGTDYIFLSKKSQIDEVFDISAYHANTPYVDLAAALGTNGNNVPQSLRKGGMSVKFIQGTAQSSDNKYIQARCIAQNFTTDVTQWQGVVEQVNENDKNLVEGGTIYKILRDNLNPHIPFYTLTEQNGALISSGDYVATTTFHSKTTNKIPCQAGQKYLYKGYATSQTVSALFYNNNTIIGSSNLNSVSNFVEIITPPNCNYVVFSSCANISATVVFEIIFKSSISYRLGEIEGNINKTIDSFATFTLGYFINVVGAFSDNDVFALSSEIELAKGNTITAFVKSYQYSTFAAIAIKNNDGTYTNVVASSTTGLWEIVTYTAVSDCTIVISTYSDDGDISKAKAYVYPNGEQLQHNLIDLQEQIDEINKENGTYVREVLDVNFNAGHYINQNGAYASNADFAVSDIIEVVESQILSYTAQGAGTVVALLARVNDDGTYTPIVMCTHSNPTPVLYKSDRNQRLVISTNKDYEVTVNSYYDDSAFKLIVNSTTKIVPNISKRQKRLYANEFNNGIYDSELNMFICYGQSWAEGYGANAISLTRRYDNIMLNTGIKNNPLESLPVTATSFSPMVEFDGTEEDGTDYLCGETPVSSQCNMVKQLIEEEDGYKYTDFPYQLLGIAPGFGSQSLAQLSKGTDWYNRLIAMVTAANSIAENLGKKLVVQAFSWLQNAKGGLTGTYAENLEQLRLDIDTDVKAITRQTQTVKCITWQTFLYDVSGGAKDCYDKYVGASETYPNIVCAGASYQFPHLTDSLHLTSLGQIMAGSMLGVAYKRTIIDGEKFIPLKPISARYSGKELYIKFNVPQKPLRIDTSVVVEAVNYGFNIINSGTEKTIESVMVIGPDTIRITCASDIATDDHITYSQNAGTDFGPIIGNRGNLRDSQGDYIKYTTEDGAVLRIDNWCVVFDKTVGELMQNT